MKVALIIDRFDAARGGGEKYAIALARGLSERGHEVHVFSQHWADPPRGVHCHRLPLISYPRWGKVLSLALYGSRVLTSKDFDVVQGFGGVPSVDVHRPGGGSELAWLRQEIRSRGQGFGPKAAATAKALGLKLAVNLLVERAIYGKVGGPAVVANSQKVRADILRYYRAMDVRRIRVIYNGVDLDRFHPRNKDLLGKKMREGLLVGRDEVVLAFLAHNFRLKGLHCLMEALRRVREREGNWVLLVGGRGRQAPFVRLAQRLGIGERVRFLGPVEMPEALLGACDILVHPTFYDPFSNVCLEAMASGVPVVTTRHNGAAELVEEAISGYVVPGPEAVDLLAEGILAMMDGGLREKMGMEARRIAEGMSWDRHIVAVEGLYRELLGVAHSEGCLRYGG